jgi:hypothetical protein
MSEQQQVELSVPKSPRFEQTELSARPSIRGKFLWRGNQKLYLKGVTYEPFNPLAVAPNITRPSRPHGISP